MPLIDVSGPILQSRVLGPRRWSRAGGGAVRRAATLTQLGTHNSTHVDAPWHYNSTIGGERAQPIDELPLDWFFADGVVLDMTAKADGEQIKVADVKAELGRIGHELKEREIVPDRAPREPGPNATNRVQGGVLPAPDRRRERGARSRGGDHAVSTATG